MNQSLYGSNFLAFVLNTLNTKQSFKALSQLRLIISLRWNESVGKKEIKTKAIWYESIVDQGRFQILVQTLNLLKFQL